MASMEQRERGLERLRELAGPNAEAVVEQITALAPDLGRWIIDFVFAEVYSRPGLDPRTRQIVNVAALGALGTATPQLEVHLDGALNVGVTQAELIEVILQLAVYAGFPASVNGIAALERVLAAREAPAAPPPSA